MIESNIYLQYSGGNTDPRYTRVCLPVKHNSLQGWGQIQMHICICSICKYAQMDICISFVFDHVEKVRICILFVFGA